MWPVPLKCRAIGTIEPSLVPRFTTMLTLIGASPAAAAASIPASTFATGNSTSFIARNVASSSESRLTVTRVRPASRRLRAFFASSAPLVVSVRSMSPSFASISTRRSMLRRRSGSPPVSRSFVTPWLDEDARDAGDFLERQELGARQELVVGAVDLLRHAVDAAEVAAVGDRDAEIAQAAGRACPRRSPGNAAPVRGARARSGRSASRRDTRTSVTGMIVAMNERRRRESKAEPEC